MTTKTIFLISHRWEIKVFVERTVLKGKKWKRWVTSRFKTRQAKACQANTLKTWLPKCADRFHEWTSGLTIWKKQKISLFCHWCNQRFASCFDSTSTITSFNREKIMTTQQQKDAREILSFVQNQRKKQTDDLLNMWIQSSQKQFGKRSYAR